jgi:hypothetical protein
MIDLLQWLISVPGYRLVPLFDCGVDLTVNTWVTSASGRRLLKRSPEMETAVIDIIEAGLQDVRWEGMLYVMGFGDFPSFQPLYAGKAERKGVKNEVSANISDIRKNKHMFARWGDGVAYHIGDLSQVLFQWKA